MDSFVATTRRPARPIWFGTIVGFIAGAIILWPPSYETMNYNGGNILVFWIIATAAAAAYSMAVLNRPRANVVLAVGAGPIAALMARIIFECTLDPTDHNLWPFEIVWAAIVSFPSAWAGTFLSRFFRR